MMREVFVRSGRLLVLIMVFAIIGGCMPAMNGDSAEGEVGIQQSEESVSTSYYDFGDVLIPEELTLNKKKSFVYRTEKFITGILAFSGRVDIESLIGFFTNNMVKDNWQLISVFKSPKSIMFFSKKNRSCIINIMDKPFSTEVEIWVAPVLGSEEETLVE
jgi:hypothetical protein